MDKRYYFSMLDETEQMKVLRKVNNLFDKAHYYKTLFKHVNFEKAFPDDYKNTPVGELAGEAGKYYEFLFLESQKMIKIVSYMLTEKQAKKELNRRKSKNHSTLRKFYKIVLKLQGGAA